jgi:hypothetical protein
MPAKKRAKAKRKGSGVTAEGLKDSGERREFPSGAVRDRGTLKGRPDLMCYFADMREAVWFEKGALKYVVRNWEKGMPLSEFYNSAWRHMEKWKAGFVDEDHLAAARWNISCAIETEERIKRGILPAELDDLPHTYAGFDDPDNIFIPVVGQLTHIK